jgi:hypothetical protein
VKLSMEIYQYVPTDAALNVIYVPMITHKAKVQAANSCQYAGCTVIRQYTRPVLYLFVDLSLFGSSLKNCAHLFSTVAPSAFPFLTGAFCLK